MQSGRLHLKMLSSWKLIAVIGIAFGIILSVLAPIIPPLMQKYDIDVQITNVELIDEQTAILNGTFNGNRYHIQRLTVRTLYPKIRRIQLPEETREWLLIEAYQNLTAQDLSTLKENLENPPPYYTVTEAFEIAQETFSPDDLFALLFAYALVLGAIIVAARHIEKKRERAH